MMQYCAIMSSPLSIKIISTFDIFVNFPSLLVKVAEIVKINNLGVYLPQPVFSHGQLYVSLSRAGIPHQTKVMISNIKDTQGSFENYDGTYTDNVVYTEIFQ